MMNHELKRALKPAKGRIRRNRFLRGAAAGLGAGLAAGVLLQVAAFFIPVPDRRLWAAAAAAGVLLLTAAVNALRPVKDITAARAADACGLKERAVTALELKDDSSICLLQHRDACEALNGLDVKKIRPGSVKKALAAALGCAVLLGGLLLIPNGQDAAAAARKALDRTLREGRQTIERAAAEDEEKLSEEKKSELRRITADLNRELDGSRDAADAMVAMDRAEQRLEQLRQQTAGEASAGACAAGENAAGNDGKGDGTQAAAEDDGSAGTSAGQAGSASAGSTAGQLKTLQALTNLKNLVNPSVQTASRGQSADGGRTGQAGQNGSGMTGNGAGNGQRGSGAGGTNSGGKTGGGAGEGTTNEEQEGGGGNSGNLIKGNRNPKYKEAEYETIYDPERIAKAREDTATEQFRLGDEDSLQVETGPGKGSLGGDVPWSEVLQDYAGTEAQAADRENLTMQEKQWVKEYYRLLTEQQ